MTTKTATARLDGDGLRFSGVTGSGHTLVMDTVEGDAGPRPAELLLLGQAGCTAMDVMSILRKKRQDVRSYEVRVTGEQREDAHPHVFLEMVVTHIVEGVVDALALERAIELSATRYCTVTGNLASGVVRIRHGYVLRTPDGAEQAGEVVVTGPGMVVPGVVSAAA
jgi:putative redox protein